MSNHKQKQTYTLQNCSDHLHCNTKAKHIRNNKYGFNHHFSSIDCHFFAALSSICFGFRIVCVVCIYVCISACVYIYINELIVLVVAKVVAPRRPCRNTNQLHHFQEIPFDRCQSCFVVFVAALFLAIHLVRLKFSSSFFSPSSFFVLLRLMFVISAKNLYISFSNVFPKYYFVLFLLGSCLYYFLLIARSFFRVIFVCVLVQNSQIAPKKKFVPVFSSLLFCLMHYFCIRVPVLLAVLGFSFSAIGLVPLFVDHLWNSQYFGRWFDSTICFLPMFSVFQLFSSLV